MAWSFQEFKETQNTTRVFEHYENTLSRVSCADYFINIEQSKNFPAHPLTSAGRAGPRNSGSGAGQFNKRRFCSVVISLTLEVKKKNQFPATLFC